MFNSKSKKRALPMREIIQIDNNKCDGCGLCVPNCHEGALKVIDGKVRLISDLFCDGLGNCIGHCPKDAIKIVKKPARPYNEKLVMEKIIPQGQATLKEHMLHLKEHNATKYLEEAIEYLEENNLDNPLDSPDKEDKKRPAPCACPGTAMRELKPKNKKASGDAKQESNLTQWPVQLNLLPPSAPFFENSDLLVCADCVPVAFPNLHSELLKDKAIVIGCPKLDDLEHYEEKLTQIFSQNNLKSITVAIMEVPCCGGLLSATQSAIEKSGKKIKLIHKTISVDGRVY